MLREMKNQKYLFELLDNNESLSPFLDAVRDMYDLHYINGIASLVTPFDTPIQSLSDNSAKNICAYWFDNFLFSDNRLQKSLFLPTTKGEIFDAMLSEVERNNNPALTFLKDVHSTNQYIHSLNLSNGYLGGYTFCRDEKKSFSEKEKIQLTSINLMLFQRLRLKQALTQRNLESNIVNKFFEEEKVGIVLLDQNGQIIQCNAIAENLQKKTKLYKLKKNQFVLENKFDNSKYKNILRKIRKSNTNDITQSFTRIWFDKDNILRTLQIKICRLPNNHNLRTDNGKVIVVIKSFTKQDIPSANEYARAFNLTPSERDTLIGILQGLNQKQISYKRFVDYETTRSHVKSILHKTKCRSQLELVAYLGKQFLK